MLWFKYHAIGLLEAAVTLDPNSIPAYQGLALFLPTIGKLNESEIAARRCVQLAPSDSDCLTFLAYSLSLAGKNDEAVSYLPKILAITPNAPAYVLGIIGHIQFAAGQPNAALETLNTCLIKAPKYVHCRRERIHVNTQLKNTDAVNEDSKLLIY